MIADGTFLESCRNNSNAVFLIKDFSVAEELISGIKEKKTAPSKVHINHIKIKDTEEMIRNEKI